MDPGRIAGRHVLLVIGGGIAAFKTLELIRRLRERGARVTPVLTEAGAQFVTPLSVAALAGAEVHRELFDLTAEARMGHIELSRAADLVVVAPATADLMARAAHGLAPDLASTLLLATDKRVLMAPAMNVRMWDHPATRRNLETLRADGVLFVGPDEGAMACGEWGSGRMAEPEAILAAIESALAPAGDGEEIPAAGAAGPLAGRHVVVTSGPTHEPIDPVRFIANRSSGAQGAAIGAALAALGARVTFVTGPAAVPPPPGVQVVAVETAGQMLAAVRAALPADAAVMAAAVADWRVSQASLQKIKKGEGGAPVLALAPNPDILATVSRLGHGRPRLVVGFAAETERVLDHARAKRQAKGCDWILANDVSPETGIMGGSENAVTLITAEGEEHWPRMGKDAVARRLAARMAEALR
ncbi:bifunctional phosphopantothenoylcysteine decarboxylase/phosphopantothenate--cysteine ligase CoaBC [Rubellimicrobium sp. CFH 75288]|uniref:bifunctional phosphopantothenoylcysteine decarboxylase/phosphopantothenate--cysteine ligase CoaBC n=1 Tax=Rubellimicrobium sp. CFH 75288 TaxID=2697034 RepID=UPI00144ED6CB|nr:bifunctional phosphopantothenoylcysteine decarboxylase/phosphopantothenate--cysteine ligase CoaBC [Rubellimicrobium sp. CFH 75288]NAZ36608.1 bifunctional phosphopantothenoylcysteine decarboxylase/phosphopantothenate--cysteine ligase CoaBC [Rubellimicrobium sp. CFH 75288]